MRALDRFEHVGARCALELGQKNGLDRRRDAFERVEPRLIHSRKREEEQARDGDRCEHELAERAQRKSLERKSQADERRRGAEGGDDRRAGRQVPHPRRVEPGGGERDAERPREQQAAAAGPGEKPGERGRDDEVGEDEQHARDAHRRGDDEGEGAVEDDVPQEHAPAARGGLLRIERHFDERAPNSKVHEADAARTAPRARRLPAA